MRRIFRGSFWPYGGTDPDQGARYMGLLPSFRRMTVACPPRFCLRAGPPAGAQYVFPELIPPDASLVVSVPQSDGAWRAFESMRIVKAAESLLHGEAKGPIPPPPA